MAESIVSVRVSEETRELFEKLSKSSDIKNKGDFLEHILIQYSLEKTKENISLLEPAVSTIQQLIQRISEVLIGAGASITTMQEKYLSDLDIQRSSSESVIQSLNNRILTLENELLESKKEIKLFIPQKEALEKKISDLQEQIIQQSEALTDKTTIINEYKKKYNELNDITTKYEKLYQENEILCNNTTKLTNELNLILTQKESLENTVSKLKRSQEELQSNFKINLQDELKKQSLQSELTLEKVKFELKQENHEKITMLQEKLLIVSDEHKNKVNTLLEKIEEKNEQILYLEKKINQEAVNIKNNIIT